MDLDANAAQHNIDWNVLQKKLPRGHKAFYDAVREAGNNIPTHVIEYESSLQQCSHCWNKSYGNDGRKPAAMTLSQFEKLRKAVGKDPTTPTNPVAADYGGVSS